VYVLPLSSRRVLVPPVTKYRCSLESVGARVLAILGLTARPRMALCAGPYNRVSGGLYARETTAAVMEPW